MFKTIKSKIIFVVIFCTICIAVTTGAIIYKNIEIEEVAQEESEEKQQQNVQGINVKGTYNQNDLTILEKQISRDKIEITYCQVDGLKDSNIQNIINKELEVTALNCYKEKITDLNEVINVSVFTNNISNFANTLSFGIHYVAKKDDDGDGCYQGYKCLNYDLTTGEKITFDKLFTENAPMEEILRKSAYYSLIKQNLGNNLSGDLVVKDYGDVEDETALFIDKYKNEKITDFEFSPTTIEVFWGEDGIIQIDMDKYPDYIAIYNRYANNQDLYVKNDIGLKNLYTLSDRKSSIYTYMNYQKGSNYFIDINLFNYDGADNKFSEKLKQEKIIELEAEVEKIKNLVYKNPDNFYILNYSIEISTIYDNSLMQNMTYCSTIGNSYEMTVHDFEENVESIIIKRNREQSEGDIPTYIYDLKDALKIEPQNINEEYNPETGEKVVI